MNHQSSRNARLNTGNVVRPSTLSIKSVRGWLEKMFWKMTRIVNWWKTVLFVCVLALAVDPLFFFIPVIDSHKFCFTLDKKLGVAVCVLRTLIDVFYVIHIIFHFITELVAPRSRASLIGELVVHSKVIRKRLFFFYFSVDIVSVLPIPQVMVLTLLSRKQKTSLVSKEILKWVMFCQSLPRSIRIYPIFREVTRASGTVAQTKWVGAALNLFFYLLPTHVIGAFWYLSAIEKKETCWREACAKITECDLTNLLCARGAGGDNSGFLNTSCPLIDPEQITNSTVFNFGIYTDALKSGVVETRDFPRKLLYCFWWGLRNLSALGQNLETSNSAGEVFFAIIICVSGVLLCAVLIGNVQKYLQSTSIRVDEWEAKKRDTEQWMSSEDLPDYLKERIRKWEYDEWEKNSGTKREAHLPSLPKDLRVEAKRIIYLYSLENVPWISFIDDDWLLNEMYDRVKPVFYWEKSHILGIGDPVKEMLIVMRGELESVPEYCETSRYSNLQIRLMKGDVWGKLLFWALDPHTSPSLPISNRNVMTLTYVSGFTLSADDLKFLAYHLRRYHSVKLQHIKHIFRCHSKSWRSWAAFYIQAAWKAHCRRKASKILQDTQRNLGATLYASRFVSKTLRYRQDDSAEFPSFPEMLPDKPADPEFSKKEA
ncbi:probable cyclic nucleotide-gated ion channel 12 [Brassica napus]|uniref:probable cyclic nucleotide-gated ion channel 12 n=1 Tax=Brassica napus TaxID=3708 RepID=UPI000BBE82F5|nr:probable cyclic nucleotide-gated ion channel 12 [Brassica napus]